MIASWAAGLLRRRPLALLGAALSLAIVVAFIASLGSFLAATRASLTTRASASVPVDWQVQVTPEGSPEAVRTALAHVPGLRSLLPVDEAIVSGLESRSSAGVRTTGRARLVALTPEYARAAPAEVRYLLGARAGVLVLQQTASNLAAGPGSEIRVTTPASTSSAPSASTRPALHVDGVIDLPAADSFFQVVGAPAGAGATAPPDNVVVLSPDAFALQTRGTPVIHQFHAIFDHRTLPADPAAAADLIRARALHFQAEAAGGALVGDNLEAVLSAAREDALYAQLLFLLLGAPGVLLACALTSLVVALRGERRRRELAILRLRGASPATILALGGVETLCTACLGALLGAGIAFAVVRLALGSTPLSSAWVGVGVAAAFLLAGLTQLGPSVRVLVRPRAASVTAASVPSFSPRLPAVLRGGGDVILLLAAGIVTFLAARSGYKVIVVPEGVPVTSVNYAALLAPALAWPGLALLVWRISQGVLARQSGRLASPSSPDAPELVAASIRARRRPLARGATALAVAIALATSTALFTATYTQQSDIDVALTVGADVAVYAPPGAPFTPVDAERLARTPGVTASEPLIHRLAYVGPDLQDIFGVRPDSIARVAPVRDSYFPGSSTRDALARLARTPDGAFLSAETLKDYQLHVGDLVRIRLQVGPSRTYQAVPFHVVGVVKEFPSAPKDSFIIAQQAYLAARTGSSALETLLFASSAPARTGAALAPVVPPGARVADVVHERSKVTTASGLAATDLAGLARIELGFALALAIAASALTLALGITERKRALVVLAALGASPRQRRRFLNAEARALLAGGVLGGAGVGVVIAQLLVKILTGIFDPAPTGLAVPGVYLAGLLAGVLISTFVVLRVLAALLSRAGPSQLRDL